MAMRSLRSVMPKRRASGTPGAAFVGGMLGPRVRAARDTSMPGEANGRRRPERTLAELTGAAGTCPGIRPAAKAGRGGGKTPIAPDRRNARFPGTVSLHSPMNVARGARQRSFCGPPRAAVLTALNFGAKRRRRDGPAPGGDRDALKKMQRLEV